jgi:glycogen debranching enzyme
MAEKHTLVGELRERTAHGRPADAVLLAELVLGGETVIRAVATTEDLLEEERLQLVVERDRLLGIDRHLGAEPGKATLLPLRVGYEVVCYGRVTIPGRVTDLAQLAETGLSVLRRNDTGHFVKPAPAVYPFQWNWDSALAAIGLARVDVARGRQEVRALLQGQWADGMVPHIVFHPTNADYSPGPELWGSGGCPGAPQVATSGLTQPPVLATAVRALHEAGPDARFLEEVLPAVDAWHVWLSRERAFDESGLVAILHPWESADNAPRFDRALARVEPGGASAVARSDRRHLAAGERPTDRDYTRYLAIVEALRRCDFRPQSLAEAPFAYVDLTFNSVLAAAEADLAWLWNELGDHGARAASAAARVREALAGRWEEDAVAYRELDLHGGEQEVSGTVGELLPLYAGVPDERQARRLFEEALWAPTRYGPSPEGRWAVTTVSKESPDFDPRRYWRGPVWINVNWFLIRGLERLGLAAEATLLRELTVELVSASGFSEYYHPSTGAPLGSRDFSWSAALTLDLIDGL